MLRCTQFAFAPLSHKAVPPMKTKLSPLCLVSCIVCLIALCSSPSALSQVPQGFNYQAIARDGTGNPITGATLQVKISIVTDTIFPDVLWEELHNPVYTNSFGLFTLVIGTGVRQSGLVTAFSDINWIVNLFIKTEVLYSGEWKNMGYAKLWSVPYAMQSKNSEQWTTNGSNIYRYSGGVGIGTSSPLDVLDVKGLFSLRQFGGTGS